MLLGCYRLYNQPARGKLATMQVPAIAPTIDHHFDVFHVEVKLIEAAKKYFEAGTKTFRVSGADDSAAKKAVSTGRAAGCGQAACWMRAGSFCTGLLPLL